MSDEITMRLHRTTDLTEAAALWSLGHPLHGIEVREGWATFVVGYSIPEEQLRALVDSYRRGELLVEAAEFARRRNETAAKMRKAIAESQAAAGGERRE
ncbi:MAG: hypothetical protein AB7Y46_05210 [Armatimonadota bacterium]